MRNELNKKYNIDMHEIIANLIIDYPGHSAFWLARVAGCGESTARRILNDFVVPGIATVKDMGQGCYHDYRWFSVWPATKKFPANRENRYRQIADFIDLNWEVIFPK